MNVVSFVFCLFDLDTGSPNFPSACRIPVLGGSFHTTVVEVMTSRSVAHLKTYNVLLVRNVCSNKSAPMAVTFYAVTMTTLNLMST